MWKLYVILNFRYYYIMLLSALALIQKGSKAIANDEKLIGFHSPLLYPCVKLVDFQFIRSPRSHKSDH